MLLLNCNVFAGSGWDGGWVCLLPESVTQNSVTLKWREPAADGYCHDAFMSLFKSSYGADSYTDVTYSIKYDEYKGNFKGPHNGFKTISLNYPGSIIINNLEHKLYIAYLVGRYHLDTGKYVERITGMCVFQPYDGSRQSYEINENISDISFATNRLTSEYESSWEYGVQYTKDSSFCPIDNLSGSVDLCVNYHNEGGYFFEDNTSRQGLYADRVRVVQNLIPATRYNVRILPIIGVGDSWYDMAGELVFDYGNAQTFTVVTKMQRYLPISITKLKTEGSYASSKETLITWRIPKGAYYGADTEYGYQLEYTDLATNQVRCVNLTNIGFTSYSPSQDIEAMVGVKQFKATSFYKIRIRGFMIGESGYDYTKWSKAIYFSPQQTSKKDVKLKATKKTIKATWKKVAGATNYTIYISDTPRGKYQKVVTTSKTSCNIKKFAGKKLQSKKSYYVKIIANKKVGSKVYKSNSNTYRKVKMK